jgi:hypothetical protein
MYLGYYFLQILLLGGDRRREYPLMRGTRNSTRQMLHNQIAHSQTPVFVEYKGLAILDVKSLDECHSRVTGYLLISTEA